MVSTLDSQPADLWRHIDFIKLWGAQAISLLGHQITILAIPIIAVTLLRATPLEMGLLTAFLSLPALMFGLLAGAWLDRRSRRPVMIVTNLARALLLATIPLAYYLDVLAMSQLYFIAFLFGLLNLVFGIAYRAFLPAIVPRASLVDGNSKLELSRAGAEIVGPGVGGVLIRLVTAPLALLIDASSLVLSALMLGSIRAGERATAREISTTIWSDMRTGLRLIFYGRGLRALAGCAATIGLFNAMLEAIFVLYVVRYLDIGPGMLGLIFSIGGAGFLAGPLIAARLGARQRARHALVAGVALVGLSDLLVPLATGPRPLVIATLILAQFLFGIGFTAFSIMRVSTQQAATPDAFQGRTHATMAVLLGIGALIGGLAGGAFAEVVGVRLILFAAAIGELAAVGWLLFVPLDVESDTELAWG